MRKLDFLKKSVATFISLLVATSSFATPQDTYPKREMRALWLTTAYGLDWPQSDKNTSSQKTKLSKIITDCKSYGLNAIYFQVRSFSDAMYKSSYEPWSHLLTGTRGKDPGWDPLAYCIEECHKNGMQCYAWINPFRFATKSNYDNWTTSQDTTLKNSGWLITGKNGTVTFDPGNTSARWRIGSVCLEIVNNYNIDGLIFDDYFYPDGGTSEESDAGDYSLYTTYKNNGGLLSIAEWRRKNVNDCLESFRNRIKDVKPWVTFGIGPGGNANHGYSLHKTELPGLGYAYSLYDNTIRYGGDYEAVIYADPCEWVINNRIDQIAPQIYWGRYHKTASFEPFTEWWSKLASYGKGIRNYISIDASKWLSTYEGGDGTTHAWNNEEYIEEVKISRNKSIDNCPGQIYYRYTGSTAIGISQFGSELKNNVYQKNALPPSQNYNGSGTTLPTAPEKITMTSSKISWANVDDNYHYAVYQIPVGVSFFDAKSKDHSDEIKADYLQDIIYNDTKASSVSFSISVNSDNYWYAVTCIDRYGNESEPCMSDNAPTEPCEATPISPISTTVENGVTFTWSGTEGASFTIDVSTDPSFPSNTSKTLSFDAGTSTTITNKNLKKIASGTEAGKIYTIYWRVNATKVGKSPYTSPVASFTVKTYKVNVSLTSPINGETATNPVTMSWTSATEGAKFAVWYSTDGSAKPNSGSGTRIKTSGTEKSFTYDFSEYKSGTRIYWQVVGTKENYTNREPYDSFILKLPNIDITLNTPDENATVTNSANFSWTGIEGAQYVVKIFADAGGTELVKSVNAGTSSSVITDLLELESGKTYYWSVTASKKGYETTTSSLKPFIAIVDIQYCIATHTSPEIGYQVTGSTVNLSWEGTVGATYTIEVSPIHEFTSQITLVYSGKSTSCSFSTSSLARNTFYYWRIKAQKEGYIDYQTWNNRHFITPSNTTKIGVPTIYNPSCGSNQKEDIVFIALAVNADNYILEIAKDENFNEIFYTKDGRGYDYETAQTSDGKYTCIQHTIPIYKFENGIYYWRVRADKEGYTSSQSETWKFVVSGRPGSLGYTLTQDPSTYEKKSSTMLNNLWIRSISNNNGIGLSNQCRSFVAHKTSNSDIGTLYIGNNNNNVLHKYNPQTGEYSGDLVLHFDSDYATSFKCNNLFVDQSNNLCIANLALDNSKLSVGVIDTNTGNVTTVTSVTVEKRCDHCGVYGTVSKSGTFYLFGASNNAQAVYRWTVTNGTAGSATTYKTETLGTGAVVHPISATNYYVTGRNNALYLYNGNTKVNTMSGFSTNVNGIYSFTHNDNKFIIYPTYAEVSSYKINNCQFTVYNTANLSSASNLISYWTYPLQSFTGSDSGDHCVFASHLSWNGSLPVNTNSFNSKVVAPNRQTTSVFVFVPGDMLAAYTMSDVISTGEENITVSPVDIMFREGQVNFGTFVDEVKIYSTSGTLVGHSYNCATISLPEAKGIYIIVANKDGKIHTLKTPMKM